MMLFESNHAKHYANETLPGTIKLVEYANIIHNFNIANNDLLSFMNSNTLSDLFNRQQNSFAINISIGFILFNNTTGEFRYFHTSQNGIGRMFERPVHVTDRESFDIFLERVQNRDFLEHASRSKPDSSWVVHRITNVTVYLYIIRSFPIGSADTLPSHIVSNKFIIGMAAYKGRHFKDQLCLWRCLAYHNQRSMSGITRRAKEMLKIYQAAQEDNSSDEDNEQKIDFAGIKLEELGLVEEAFKLSIYVYELKPAHFNNQYSLTIRRRSAKKHANIVHLHLYNNHFSYITDIKRVSKKFKCDRCYKLWKTSSSLQRHMKGCSTKTKVIHPSRLFHPPKSVFEKLEENKLCLKEKTSFLRVCTN